MLNSEELTEFFNRFKTWVIVIGCVLFTPINLIAQNKDTSNKVTITIHTADIGGMFTQKDGKQVNRLVGNVALQQDETMFYCDSAYFNIETNNVEAFGNVQILQPNTTVFSDYLRYTGNTKKAFLKDNVVLTNGEDQLWADQLDYDLNSKLGIYNNGGTLQSGTTTLTSAKGQYNTKTKDSRFTGDVIVIDPKYEIFSDDLGYNTDSKIVQFYGKSTVTNEQSILVTTKGSYDTKKKISKFTKRTSIWNKELYLEGDQLDYNEHTGIALAKGNVFALDTLQQLALYCGIAHLNEKEGSIKAYIKPVLKKVNGSDSLYLRVDTMFTAPIPNTSDTVNGKFVPRVGTNDLSAQDTSYNEDQTSDTTRLRYFKGYYNVKIFSDSLQAICDSIFYSQADSTLRLLTKPIAWSRNAQITGDQIWLLGDSTQIKKITVPGNSLVVSQSGPEKALLFDQVQGDTLYGYFNETKQLDNMWVQPNAESIYYAKDDRDAYIGMNQSTSQKMQILFEEGELRKVIPIKDVNFKMTPIPKINRNEAKLSRFQWHKNKRPKTLEELFD